MGNDGKADGLAVAREACARLAVAFGSRTVSTWLLGSLAHGGFRPAVSDVDVAVLLADPLQDDDAATVAAAVDRMRGSSELADRLSVFWGSPASLAGAVPGGRFPAVDRVDLLDSGILVTGSDVRDETWRPSPDEMVVEAARFALAVLATDDTVGALLNPERLVAQGARALTKKVLFPVRFLYTAATGRIGRNDDAVAWYVALPGPSAALVAAAAGWRGGVVDGARALELCRWEIVPLYVEMIDRHVERMCAVGEAGLAADLGEWRSRLRLTARPR